MTEAGTEKRARKLCFSDEPKTAIGWQCGACSALYTIRGHADAEQLANDCCNLLCRQCDGQTRKGMALCEPCRRKAESAREKQLFEAAKKIRLDEYRGKMLYAVETYFEPDCVEDVQKGLEEENRDVLTYAWACSEEAADFDLGDAVDTHLHDNYGEATADNLEGPMLDAAQILVDEALAKCVEYRQRTDLAVLLPPFPQETSDAGPETGR